MPVTLYLKIKRRRHFNESRAWQTGMTIKTVIMKNVIHPNENTANSRINSQNNFWCGFLIITLYVTIKAFAKSQVMKYRYLNTMTGLKRIILGVVVNSIGLHDR